MSEQMILLADALKHNEAYDEALVEKNYQEALKKFDRKIVVLDDDPTGIQTIHDIYVYVHWDVDTIRKAFDDEKQMFFILTNSRGLTRTETEKLHREIAENIVTVSKETGKEFIVISRGDSTLRGHIPLETETLKNVFAAHGIPTDGEIYVPFFREGGRYTVGDVHYMTTDNVNLIPVGETEFAKDWTFGYKNSNLKKFIEEKTEGKVKAENVLSVSLDELAALDYSGIEKKLESLEDFGKLILNCTSYTDLKVFTTAFINAVQSGKNYIFRSAAAVTKILGGVPDKPLLSKAELSGSKSFGLTVVGSHVKKTTAQLEALKNRFPGLHYIEFDIQNVLNAPLFEAEIVRVKQELHDAMAKEESAVVYTSRADFEVKSGDKEDELRAAVKISNAVTSLISTLDIQPGYMIAKGGITSSEIGTKGLEVNRALCIGQILPGIPVWKLGPESRFEGMPYIIFPGNVGSVEALADAVGILDGKEN